MSVIVAIEVHLPLGWLPELRSPESGHARSGRGGQRHLVNRRQIAATWLVALIIQLLIQTAATAAVVTIDASALPAASVQSITIQTLRWDETNRRFTSVDQDWDRTSAEGWTADLEPGGYQIELQGEGSAQTIFCRSRRLSVREASAQWIVEPKIVRVQFVHRGEPLGLRHLSIRSFNTTGEVIVHDGPAQPNAEIVTTEETRLDVTLIGEDSDTLALGHAVVKPATARAGSADELLATVTASGRHWYERPVLFSPDNPPIRSASLTLVHPRGELVVPYRKGVEVVTNRPLFHLGYKLESEAGQKLISRRCFVAVGKIKRFVLGGKLHPSGFARVFTRLPKSKELRVAGLLTDSEGIEINVHESKIDWTESFTLRRTEPLPKNPLDAAELGLLADPMDTVRIKVSWNWSTPREREMRPAPFVEYRSQHFVLNAPVAWRDRAEIYLTELEHCYAILKRTTGRSGPRRTRIMWRLNTHNAKAKVGGRKSWMSMPLKGLYNAVDPFGRPQFMVHEMLHTFGFNHGPKMTEHQNLGHAEMSLTRWDIPWRLYNNADVQIGRSSPSN